MIPKLIYPSTILNTPPEVITRTDNILNKFLWNWKSAKIKKDIMIRTIKNGGIKVPCIDCKITSWKSIWAIRCLKNENEDPLWVHLVSSMLPTELTLTFLLKSRPNEKDLSKYCPNLPLFYRNIIINWVKVKSKILTTKEQIKNECIWLNNFILSNNNTLYSAVNIKNKLCSIKDICNENGSWKNLHQINTEFKTNLNFLDFLRIRQCIPYTWKQILNNNTLEDKSTEVHYNKMQRYKTLKSSTIYWLSVPFKHDMFTKPKSHIYWTDRYNIEDIGDYLISIFTCIRITTLQTLQYKVVNRIFNCNYWLNKIKIINSAKCRFCTEIETIEHYFYGCQKTHEFWNLIKNWWNQFRLITIGSISEKDVILSSVVDNKFTIVYNCILSIAKGSIYNNKSNNKQPDFYCFLVQLKYFLRIEEQIHIKNNTSTKFELLWSDISEQL
jgi:hypothetical protein